MPHISLLLCVFYIKMSEPLWKRGFVNNALNDLKSISSDIVMCN